MLRGLAKFVDLQSIRRLIICSGQVEQGIADACECGKVDPGLLADYEEMTNQAALAFVRYRSTATVEEILHKFDVSLHRIKVPPCELTIKIPEGFAFYRLYPEQFLAAAEQWRDENASAKDAEVRVVGVRSIGTSLSAVVSAALLNSGWKVSRCTVRPAGDPFRRKVQFIRRSQASYAIIVDEGPGLSGSSMVAVADAVVASGIAPENVTFLPGHGGLPGNACSDDLRERWRRTRRIFVPLEQIRWQQKTLEEHLCAETSVILQQPIAKWEDIGGGEWRRHCYRNETEWPAMFPAFERSKLKCTAADGTALLWKFDGLEIWGGPVDRSFSRSPYAIPRVAVSNGYSAFPWIHGNRLTLSDAHEMVVPLACHISASARPPLSASEHRWAVQRLAEMTFWNTRCLLGEDCATRAVLFSKEAESVPMLPSFGDGHLAPWEWIRTKQGSFYKSDSWGLDVDHTIVGAQSILWDMAGAIVEWNLTETEVNRFLQLMRRELEINPDALRFFQSAYCAFQLGKSAMARDSVSDSTEKTRLMLAIQFYGRRLLDVVAVDQPVTSFVR